MTTQLLKMSDICKSFGPIQVLNQAQLTVNVGEVHGLMGENGAGKSTLMNILSGALTPDNGEISFEGAQIATMTPEKSKQLGIGFVQQELNLAEDLSVAENIYMGRLPLTKRKTVDYSVLYENTSAILHSLAIDFSAETLVSALTPADRQMVEIAKSISLQAKLIIFDEPTTSLSNKDVAQLFNVIGQLREAGVSSIYISHRMDEIFELCDRITVLRDGNYIQTVHAQDSCTEAIIKMMVGRDLSQLYPRSERMIGERTLAVKGLSDKQGKVKQVSFHIHQGEVVGFSGLVGSGRTELMRLIFGADPKAEGEIHLRDKRITITSPKEAIAHGICLLTEDRKHQGLALTLSVSDNINLAHMPSFIIDQKAFHAIAQQYIAQLSIKVPNEQTLVSSLSGGNQQKVVLGKWLNTQSEVLIFDEPTKGIDVGTKTVIYELIDALAKSGKSILVVSSELPELLGISDRVYVLCEGRMTGHLAKKDFDAEEIMRLSTIGGEKHEA